MRDLSPGLYANIPAELRSEKRWWPNCSGSTAMTRGVDARRNNKTSLAYSRLYERVMATGCSMHRHSCRATAASCSLHAPSVGCWLLLRHASLELRGDRVCVLVAVRRNGMALQHASAALRDDRECVMAAVRNDGMALEFASFRLQSDSSIVREAVVHARSNSFDGHKVLKQAGCVGVP